MPDREPTVLIIGAGTFGTSTAYHLSKTYHDPSRITLLDRWDPTAALPDKPAAAVDTNRIIRTDYASRLYCDLANEAIHFWFWSIAVQGHFHKTGWTVLEPTKGGAGFGDAVRRTFRERGGDYTRGVEGDEVLQEVEVLRGVRSQDFATGYRNPEAGWCDAEKATTSFTKVALERGVKRVVGEVRELLVDGEQHGLRGVRLRDGRVLEADQIVLAAGAWTSALLSPVEDALGMKDKDRIERQITAVGRISAYYTLSERETQDMIDAKVPVVVLAGLADIIPPSQPNRTLKLNDLRTEIINTTTTASGHRITVPSSRHQTHVPWRLIQESKKVIDEAMPVWSGERTPDRWRICYDAVTPTEDWLMCRHPSAHLTNLYLAVGGSFHSYKFLPIAGKYMLNVLNNKSNGKEKDQAWGWKSAQELMQRAGKEFGNSPSNGKRRDISEYEDAEISSKL